MKILIIEDEKPIGKLILSYMKQWKMDAVLAQTPHEALELLKDDEIDLLVTDQYLPEMMGTDLVKRLHSMDKYQDLPVLMISGLADKQAIIAANEAGITHFMAKPLQPDELKKRLLTIYRAQQRQTQARQIRQIWNGRNQSMHDIFSPHIVFGEPLSKIEDLKKPDNRHIIPYLNDAREIIEDKAMLQTFNEGRDPQYRRQPGHAADLQRGPGAGLRPQHHNLAVGYAAHILGYPLDDDQARATHGNGVQSLGLDPEVEALLRQIDLPARLKLDYACEIPFIGGIMHDLGKGAMVQSYPGLSSILLIEMQKAQWNAPMLSVEQDLTGGLTHTVVGEILARQWGLENELCQVILHHHQPEIDNPFAMLISIADIIGQALYPFPKGLHHPLAQALADGDLCSASSFLPAGFFDNPLLSPEEFIALARVITPKVNYYTEKMSQSI